MVMTERGKVMEVEVAGAPQIDDLKFRLFAGPSDYPAMVHVFNESLAADGLEWTTTIEETAEFYADAKNCDPYKDLVIAEINRQIIGFSRMWWYDEAEGTRLYAHGMSLLVEWRGKGIEEALLRYCEGHLRDIGGGHSFEGPRMFACFASDLAPVRTRVLLENGYEPVRHSFTMVRPDLENIPDCPLPEGIEVRPVRNEHLRAIFAAEAEAFQDHWGAWEVEEGDFERWCKGVMFQPEKWQVAWDGDQVVGMVRNFISPEENERFGRQRGYTEAITVRRPWRKKGVAKALIARSLKMHKDLGMTEAALGVDTENLSGALQLYESMGFRVVSSQTYYRKPLNP